MCFWDFVQSIYVERSAFLRDVHFLSHLSDYDIAKIANLAQDGKYKKHQFIVKEGDDGDTFFILTETGRNKVFILQIMITLGHLKITRLGTLKDSELNFKMSYIEQILVFLGSSKLIF